MNFRTLLAICAFVTIASPATVSAQESQPSGPPPGVQQLRDNAKAAAMNDLSPDHRSAVQAIVQKFDAGSLSMSDASTQIDAVLTPDETKAVLAEAQKYRDAMRQAFASGGGPPGGGPGGGGPPPGGMGGPPGGPGGNRTPDAGRFLLRVSASPAAMQQQFQRPPTM